jgi:hypothetical protein
MSTARLKHHNPTAPRRASASPAGGPLHKHGAPRLAGYGESLQPLHGARRVGQRRRRRHDIACTVGMAKDWLFG